MRFIVTDIDGVLTDGRFCLDAKGNESKQICYRDLDAIGIGRRNGFEFIFVTGESGELVSRIADRFNVKYVYEGAKDKLSIMKEICNRFSVSRDQLVYIGDSDRDAPALAYVARSYCPKDATRKAKASSKTILDLNGGFGVLLEVLEIELEMQQFSCITQCSLEG